MAGQSNIIEPNTVDSLPCSLSVREQVDHKIYLFATHFHLLSVNMQIFFSVS